MLHPNFEVWVSFIIDCFVRNINIRVVGLNQLDNLRRLKKNTGEIFIFLHCFNKFMKGDGFAWSYVEFGIAIFNNFKRLRLKKDVWDTSTQI